MLNFLKICIISSVMLIIVIVAEQNEDILVDNLMEWYKRREEKITYPTDARMHEATDKIPQDYGEFDFIIVGAGASGCIVASRLSEISQWNILLLEAGTYRDEHFTRIPGWHLFNIQSHFNWGFVTVPQHHSFLGRADRRSLVYKGKGVGGSPLINSFAYTRGDKLDYDRWGELVNDPEWNYQNVLPYFKKFESFTKKNPYAPIDEEYHGFDGPLHISHVIPPDNFTKTVFEAVKELGYKIVDHNGKQTLGASIHQYYMKDGLRFDPEMAYLSPVQHRKNLKILDRSYVTKIQISKESKEVEGVIFTRGNKTYIARIGKEVILSAGAVSSPKILMLSGIGPRDHLDSLKIPVTQDLPVGTTLMDHSITHVFFATNFTKKAEKLQKSIKDVLNGEGPLTKVCYCDAVVFFQTPVEETENYPDIEIMFTDTPVALGIHSDTIRGDLNPDSPNSFAIQIVRMHQKSTGTIKLKSADPFDYPLIDPNYFSDQKHEDLEALYQALQLFLKLTETQAFRRYNVSLSVKQISGCSNTEFLSREYWYCYFRRVVGLGLHEMATCLMGSNPQTGVVDSKLRVFGISGLRVADSSVIPISLTAHTNGPSNMIGEKASDLIKEAYRFKVTGPMRIDYSDDHSAKFKEEL